ncbi:lanthionine synthetase C family protein [Sphaerisporangium corydalis]|uniref:Lanthionine synthetase C family protein n=1 Tax=Sphaerisporangium corydalis TaxID=1441875 RepID=A0ABV9E758_9ACTN|nr:lanthionine synthetase C family protein [Sphaerisporangium corydalis]
MTTTSPGTRTTDSAGAALAIADRLLDTEPIITAAGSAATSLSRGLAGTALLHARLSRCHPRFATAADLHWTRAARMNISAPPRTGGVFNGVGALAASLILGTPYLPDPGPYQAAVRRSVEWLTARAIAIAAWQQDWLDASQAGMPWQTYDLINGLSGIGRILLAAVQAGHLDAESGLLAASNSLTTMIETPRRDKPGWWRPQPHNPAALSDPHNCDAANTGLAHGIAGPLAFLAECQLAGRGCAAQPDAIRTAAHWLLQWRAGDSWPPQVTVDDLAGTSTSPSSRGRRDAWCYGAPGIGAALFAAGRAVADPRLIEAARSAIDALAVRTGEWDTEGPTVCHGSAGVLLCAGLTGSHVTADLAADALIAQYDPQLPFCFQHRDHGRTIDEPGLLVGAAGIALALADRSGLATRKPPTTWTAALLLPTSVSLPE